MGIATIRPVTDRAEWLEARRATIGASEAPGALGCSPFATPREVYLRKIGRLPEQQPSEAMELGLLMEPVIAELYQRRTDREILAQQLHYVGNGDLSHLSATIDGLTVSGRVVEFKTTGTWGAREIGDEADDLPEHWLIQGHQQMLLTDVERMDFAILIAGQRFVIRTVERNNALTKAMVRGLADFWACVQSRVPPAETDHRDSRLMHLIYPQVEGEIDLTDQTAEAVERYQALGEEAKGIEDVRSRYKTAILERLGNHGVGYLPDGRMVTRRIVEVEEQCITRKAFSYVDLRIKKGRTR